MVCGIERKYEEIFFFKNWFLIGKNNMLSIEQILEITKTSLFYKEHFMYRRKNVRIAKRD